MQPVIWLAIALILGSIEVLWTSFAFMLAGLSAVLAFVAAKLGASLDYQVVVFAVAMVLSLGFLRPVLVRKFHSHDTHIPGRAEALVGKIGVVTNAFAGGQGRVDVAGEDWAARSSKDLEPGVQVRVSDHDGIVLVVEKT